MATFFMIVLFFLSLMLMFIVLIQRGRGGGLAGALGGMGGQSVLGTKAGDVFTKITVGLAIAWLLLAGIGGMALRAKYSKGTKYDDTGVIDESKFMEGESEAGGGNTPPIADGSEDEVGSDADKGDESTDESPADGDSKSSAPDVDTKAPAEGEPVGETTTPAIPDSPELPKDPETKDPEAKESESKN